MRTDHRLTAGMALIAFFLIAMLGRDAGAQGQPDGQLTIASMSRWRRRFSIRPRRRGSAPRSCSCTPCTMRC